MLCNIVNVRQLDSLNKLCCVINIIIDPSFVGRHGCGHSLCDNVCGHYISYDNCSVNTENDEAMRSEMQLVQGLLRAGLLHADGVPRPRMAMGVHR